MPEKLPVSVSIISFNEEENISRTLSAIDDFVSEIIIVDSHSTDRTLEIARTHGAKIFIEDWKGHIAQKNSALEKCSMEWILCLDCDEVITGELKNSIINSINNSGFEGYSLNRRTFYLGKLLKHSWLPDKKLRLVKKNANPHWEGLDPHDELKIQGITSNLHGDLSHYSYKDVKTHFIKTVEYAQTSAKSYYTKGRKFSFSNLLINPLIAFIRLYFLNLGFLDGIHGLIAGFSTYVYTFLKYIFLYELENTKRTDKL